MRLQSDRKCRFILPLLSGFHPTWTGAKSCDTADYLLRNRFWSTVVLIGTRCRSLWQGFDPSRLTWSNLTNRRFSRFWKVLEDFWSFLLFTTDKFTDKLIIALLFKNIIAPKGLLCRRASKIRCAWTTSRTSARKAMANPPNPGLSNTKSFFGCIFASFLAVLHF